MKKKKKRRSSRPKASASHKPPLLEDPGLECGNLLKQSQPDKALEIARRWAGTQPDNPQAHNTMGVCLVNMGDLPQAQIAFEQALQLDPNSHSLMANLGKVHFKLGDPVKAESYLQKAWQLGGSDSNSPLRALLDQCKDQMSQPPLAEANKEPAASDDPYLKLVPQELRKNKTGLNVLIYADFNVAGQLTRLCRALNRYTPHKARCIIFQEDFLQYDRDLVIKNKEGQQEVTDFSEIQDLVKKADFFHIGRQAIDLPGASFGPILREDNCIVQYFGSFLRLNHERLFWWHFKKNIAALVGWGWTQSFPLHRKFYHVQQFYDPDKFERVPRLKPGEKVRVVHAPTNREIKRTDEFLGVMERLKSRFNVEVDIIEGVPNQECLRRKSLGHITYDEMGTPTFGLNSVESMSMGHVCLSSVNPHVLSYLPDTPVVRVTSATLESLLEKLLADNELINRIGDLSYDFVRRHYDEERSAVRMSHLYNGIKYGFFHCDPGLPLGAE